MKADEPKLLRISKAAHELGLHPFTVRKWIKQGKIAAIWIGQEARVPRSEIERLVGRTDGRLIVLYGRVSGQGQKGDLTPNWPASPLGRKLNAQGSPRWFPRILDRDSKRPVVSYSDCSSWFARIRWQKSW